MTPQERQEDERQEVNAHAPSNAPPPITAIEAAVLYLQWNSDRARRCPNLGCETPYFMAQKKGQKYCSEGCAIPAQRAAKLRWWHENSQRRAAAQRRKGRK